MKVTPIGERNCLCKLMASVGGERDSRGQPTETPQEIGKFWCKIEQLSATEILAFNQQYPSATSRVTTVWCRSVNPTPAMWFEYQGRRLEIVGINNVEERNIEWRFLCSEQVKV
jgi:SPP1 family predicted phage head-tail adaptor